MRQPSRFKKTEVTRIAKALMAAGLEIDVMEVTSDGSIMTKLRKPGDVGNGAAAQSEELDRELAEFEADRSES